MLVSVVGKTPFLTNDSVTTPQQWALSRMAMVNRIAIAANIFVSVSNGSRYIAEIVFNQEGVVLAVYNKHHLFPNEVLSGFTAGSFRPTVIDHAGHRLGIIICYEGLYPAITGYHRALDRPPPSPPSHPQTFKRRRLPMLRSARRR